MNPKNKGLQTLPDKRGKIKNCNPDRSFPCGKACLSISSDILGKCQKNLLKNTQNQSLKLLESLKPLSSKNANSESTLLKDVNITYETSPIEMSNKIKEWEDYIDKNIPILKEINYNDIPNLTNHQWDRRSLNKWIDKLEKSEDVLLEDNIAILSLQDQAEEYLKAAKKYNVEPTVQKSGDKVIVTYRQYKNGSYQDVTKELDQDEFDGKKDQLTINHLKSLIVEKKIQPRMAKDNVLRKVKEQLEESEKKISQSMNKKLELIEKAGIDLQDKSSKKTLLNIIDFVDQVKEVKKEFKNLGKLTNRTLVAVDNKGQPQSMMITTEQASALKIDYILSAPWNIIPNVDNKKKVEEDAERSMLLTAIKRSEELGKKGKIVLNSLESKVDYYKSLGFVESGSKYGVTKMTLSEKSAKEMRSKFASS